jgi:hypothetical protein
MTTQKEDAKAASDSDTTTVYSTELGDCSNTDSEPTSAGVDGYDSEISLHDVKTVGLPPGLAAPPGLDAPPGLTFQAPIRTPLGTRLNSQAPLFVPGGGFAAPHPAEPTVVNRPPGNFRPSLAEMLDGSLAPSLSGQTKSSQQLRQSIQSLKGALEEWEASMPTEDDAPPWQQHSTQDQQPMIDVETANALQAALSKLTVQDTAKLRSFLGSKELEQSGQAWQAPFAMPVADAEVDVGSGQFYGPSFPAAAPMGMQYPNTQGSVVHTVPPPGAVGFSPVTMFPGVGMSAMAGAAHPHPRTPFGSHQPRAKASCKNAPEASAQSTAEDAKDTLRTNLRDLSFCDPACVLMVRKINRLGLESEGVLEAYFSKFGTVSRVMVSHSRAKSIFGRGAARIRPAGLGFLIMETAEAVQAILAEGKEHDVNGATISTHLFESRDLEGAQE